jgi:AcrR family transcriptional regulator
MNDLYTATKEIIFDKAIDMIATVGFESMSMRDLAEAAGIKVASVYNHFSSKHEILVNIYDYYCRHVFDNRPPIEQSKRVIESGSREEIYKTITYDFTSADEKKYRRMVHIVKIIMMRIFNDERARHIFVQLNCTESAVYVKELLEYGISIGRFEQFDTDTYINFLIGQTFFMGIKAFTTPGYFAHQLKEEVNIGKMLMEFLPLK